MKQKKIEIRQKPEKNLVKLWNKYKTEQSILQKKVQRKIKQSGVQSHQELLLNQSKHKELSHYLKRLAILRHNLKWLASSIEKAKGNPLDLEQAEWKLEHFLEMSEVASSNANNASANTKDPAALDSNHVDQARRSKIEKATCLSLRRSV